MTTGHDEIRIRIDGAVSDLHAADARYHVDCLVNFTSKITTSAAVKLQQSESKSEEDIALTPGFNIGYQDIERRQNSTLEFCRIA